MPCEDNYNNHIIGDEENRKRSCDVEDFNNLHQKNVSLSLLSKCIDSIHPSSTIVLGHQESITASPSSTIPKNYLKSLLGEVKSNPHANADESTSGSTSDYLGIIRENFYSNLAPSAEKKLIHSAESLLCEIEELSKKVKVETCCYDEEGPSADSENQKFVSFFEQLSHKICEQSALAPLPENVSTITKKLQERLVRGDVGMQGIISLLVTKFEETQHFGLQNHTPLEQFFNDLISTTRNINNNPSTGSPGHDQLSTKFCAKFIEILVNKRSLASSDMSLLSKAIETRARLYLSCPSISNLFDLLNDLCCYLILPLFKNWMEKMENEKYDLFLGMKQSVESVFSELESVNSKKEMSVGASRNNDNLLLASKEADISFPGEKDRLKDGDASNPSHTNVSGSTRIGTSVGVSSPLFHFADKSSTFDDKSQDILLSKDNRMRSVVTKCYSEDTATDSRLDLSVLNDILLPLRIMSLYTPLFFQTSLTGSKYAIQDEIVNKSGTALFRRLFQKQILQLRIVPVERLLFTNTGEVEYSSIHPKDLVKGRIVLQNVKRTELIHHDYFQYDYLERNNIQDIVSDQDEAILSIEVRVAGTKLYIDFIENAGGESECLKSFPVTVKGSKEIVLELVFENSEQQTYSPSGDSLSITESLNIFCQGNEVGQLEIPNSSIKSLVATSFSSAVSIISPISTEFSSRAVHCALSDEQLTKGLVIDFPSDSEECLISSLLRIMQEFMEALYMILKSNQQFFIYHQRRLQVKELEAFQLSHLLRNATPSNKPNIVYNYYCTSREYFRSNASAPKVNGFAMNFDYFVALDNYSTGGIIAQERLMDIMDMLLDMECVTSSLHSIVTTNCSHFTALYGRKKAFDAINQLVKQFLVNKERNESNNVEEPGTILTAVQNHIAENCGDILQQAMLNHEGTDYIVERSNPVVLLLRDLISGITLSNEQLINFYSSVYMNKPKEDGEIKKKWREERIDIKEANFWSKYAASIFDICSPPTHPNNSINSMVGYLSGSSMEQSVFSPATRKKISLLHQLSIDDDYNLDILFSVISTSLASKTCPLLTQYGKFGYEHMGMSNLFSFASKVHSIQYLKVFCRLPEQCLLKIVDSLSSESLISLLHYISKHQYDSEKNNEVSVFEASQFWKIFSFKSVSDAIVDKIVSVEMNESMTSFIQKLKSSHIKKYSSAIDFVLQIVAHSNHQGHSHKKIPKSGSSLAAILSSLKSSDEEKKMNLWGKDTIYNIEKDVQECDRFLNRLSEKRQRSQMKQGVASSQLYNSMMNLISEQEIDNFSLSIDLAKSKSRDSVSYMVEGCLSMICQNLFFSYSSHSLASLQKIYNMSIGALATGSESIMTESHMSLLLHKLDHLLSLTRDICNSSSQVISEKYSAMVHMKSASLPQFIPNDGTTITCLISIISFISLAESFISRVEDHVITLTGKKDQVRKESLRKELAVFRCQIAARVITLYPRTIRLALRSISLSELPSERESQFESLNEEADRPKRMLEFSSMLISCVLVLLNWKYDSGTQGQNKNKSHHKILNVLSSRSKEQDTMIEMLLSNPQSREEVSLISAKIKMLSSIRTSIRQLSGAKDAQLEERVVQSTDIDEAIRCCYTLPEELNEYVSKKELSVYKGSGFMDHFKYELEDSSFDGSISPSFSGSPSFSPMFSSTFSNMDSLSSFDLDNGFEGRPMRGPLSLSLLKGCNTAWGKLIHDCRWAPMSRSCEKIEAALLCLYTHVKNMKMRTLEDRFCDINRIVKNYASKIVAMSQLREYDEDYEYSTNHSMEMTEAPLSLNIIRKSIRNLCLNKERKECRQYLLDEILCKIAMAIISLKCAPEDTNDLKDSSEHSNSSPLPARVRRAVSQDHMSLDSHSKPISLGEKMRAYGDATVERKIVHKSNEIRRRESTNGINHSIESEGINPNDILMELRRIQTKKSKDGGVQLLRGVTSRVLRTGNCSHLKTNSSISSSIQHTITSNDAQEETVQILEESDLDQSAVEASTLENLISFIADTHVSIFEAEEIILNERINAASALSAVHQMKLILLSILFKKRESSAPRQDEALPDILKFLLPISKDPYYDNAVDNISPRNSANSNNNSMNVWSAKSFDDTVCALSVTTLNTLLRTAIDKDINEPLSLVFHSVNVVLELWFRESKFEEVYFQQFSSSNQINKNALLMYDAYTRLKASVIMQTNNYCSGEKSLTGVSIPHFAASLIFFSSPIIFQIITNNHSPHDFCEGTLVEKASAFSQYFVSDTDSKKGSRFSVSRFNTRQETVTSIITDVDNENKDEIENQRKIVRSRSWIILESVLFGLCKETNSNEETLPSEAALRTIRVLLSSLLCFGSYASGVVKSCDAPNLPTPEAGNQTIRRIIRSNSSKEILEEKIIPEAKSTRGIAAALTDSANLSISYNGMSNIHASNPTENELLSIMRKNSPGGPERDFYGIVSDVNATTKPVNYSYFPISITSVNHARLYSKLIGEILLEIAMSSKKAAASILFAMASIGIVSNKKFDDRGMNAVLKFLYANEETASIYSRLMEVCIDKGTDMFDSLATKYQSSFWIARKLSDKSCFESAKKFVATSILSWIPTLTSLPLGFIAIDANDFVRIEDQEGENGASSEVPESLPRKDTLESVQVTSGTASQRDALSVSPDDPEMPHLREGLRAVGVARQDAVVVRSIRNHNLITPRGLSLSNQRTVSNASISLFDNLHSILSERDSNNGFDASLLNLVRNPTEFLLLNYLLTRIGLRSPIDINSFLREQNRTSSVSDHADPNVSYQVERGLTRELREQVLRTRSHSVLSNENEPFAGYPRSATFVASIANEEFEAALDVANTCRIVRSSRNGGIVISRLPLTFPSLESSSHSDTSVSATVPFRLRGTGRLGVTIAPATSIFGTAQDVFDRNDVVGLRTAQSLALPEDLYAAHVSYNDGDILDVRIECEPATGEEQACLRVELFVAGESIGSVLEVYFDEVAQIDETGRMCIVFTIEDVITIEYEGERFNTVHPSRRILAAATQNTLTEALIDGDQERTPFVVNSDIMANAAAVRRAGAISTVTANYVVNGIVKQKTIDSSSNILSASITSLRQLLSKNENDRTSQHTQRPALPKPNSQRQLSTLDCSTRFMPITELEEKESTVWHESRKNILGTFKLMSTILSRSSTNTNSSISQALRKSLLNYILKKINSTSITISQCMEFDERYNDFVLSENSVTDGLYLITLLSILCLYKDMNILSNYIDNIPAEAPQKKKNTTDNDKDVDTIPVASSVTDPSSVLLSILDDSELISFIFSLSDLLMSNGMVSFSRQISKNGVYVANSWYKGRSIGIMYSLLHKGWLAISFALKIFALRYPGGIGIIEKFEGTHAIMKTPSSGIVGALRPEINSEKYSINDLSVVCTVGKKVFYKKNSKILTEKANAITLAQLLWQSDTILMNFAGVNSMNDEDSLGAGEGANEQKSRSDRRSRFKNESLPKSIKKNDGDEAIDGTDGDGSMNSPRSRMSHNVDTAPVATNGLPTAAYSHEPIMQLLSTLTAANENIDESTPEDVIHHNLRQLRTLLEAVRLPPEMRSENNNETEEFTANSASEVHGRRDINTLPVKNNIHKTTSPSNYDKKFLSKIQDEFERNDSINFGSIASICGIPQTVLELTNPPLIASSPVLPVENIDAVWNWTSELAEVWCRDNEIISVDGKSLSDVEKLLAVGEKKANHRLFNLDTNDSVKILAVQMVGSVTVWNLLRTIVETTCALVQLLPDYICELMHINDEEEKKPRSNALESSNKSNSTLLVDAAKRGRGGSVSGVLSELESMKSDDLDIYHYFLSDNSKPQRSKNYTQQVLKLFRCCIYFTCRDHSYVRDNYWKSSLRSLERNDASLDSRIATAQYLYLTSYYYDPCFSFQRCIYRAIEGSSGSSRDKLVGVIQTELLYHIVGSISQLISLKPKTNYTPTYCSLSPSVHVLHWLLSNFNGHPLIPFTLKKAIFNPAIFTAFLGVVSAGANLPIYIAIDICNFLMQLLNIAAQKDRAFSNACLQMTNELTQNSSNSHVKNIIVNKILSEQEKMQRWGSVWTTAFYSIASCSFCVIASLDALYDGRTGGDCLVGMDSTYPSYRYRVFAASVIHMFAGSMYLLLDKQNRSLEWKRQFITFMPSPLREFISLFDVGCTQYHMAESRTRNDKIQTDNFERKLQALFESKNVSRITQELNEYYQVKCLRTTKYDDDDFDFISDSESQQAMRKKFFAIQGIDHDTLECCNTLLISTYACPNMRTKSSSEEEFVPQESSKLLMNNVDLTLDKSSSIFSTLYLNLFSGEATEIFKNSITSSMLKQNKNTNPTAQTRKLFNDTMNELQARGPSLPIQNRRLLGSQPVQPEPVPEPQQNLESDDSSDTNVMELLRDRITRSRHGRNVRNIQIDRNAAGQENEYSYTSVPSPSVLNFNALPNNPTVTSGDPMTISPILERFPRVDVLENPSIFSQGERDRLQNILSDIFLLEGRNSSSAADVANYFALNPNADFDLIDDVNFEELNERQNIGLISQTINNRWNSRDSNENESNTPSPPLRLPLISDIISAEETLHSNMSPDDSITPPMVSTSVDMLSMQSNRLPPLIDEDMQTSLFSRRKSADYSNSLIFVESLKQSWMKRKINFTSFETALNEENARLKSNLLLKNQDTERLNTSEYPFLTTTLYKSQIFDEKGNLRFDVDSMRYILAIANVKFSQENDSKIKTLIDILGNDVKVGNCIAFSLMRLLRRREKEFLLKKSPTNNNIASIIQQSDSGANDNGLNNTVASILTASRSSLESSNVAYTSEKSDSNERRFDEIHKRLLDYSMVSGSSVLPPSNSSIWKTAGAQSRTQASNIVKELSSSVLSLVSEIISNLTEDRRYQKYGCSAYDCVELLSLCRAFIMLRAKIVQSVSINFCEIVSIVYLLFSQQNASTEESNVSASINVFEDMLLLRNQEKVSLRIRAQLAQLLLKNFSNDKSCSLRQEESSLTVVSNGELPSILDSPRDPSSLETISMMIPQKTYLMAINELRVCTCEKENVPHGEPAYCGYRLKGTKGICVCPKCSFCSHCLGLKSANRIAPSSILWGNSTLIQKNMVFDTFQTALKRDQEHLLELGHDTLRTLSPIVSGIPIPEKYYLFLKPLLTNSTVQTVWSQFLKKLSLYSEKYSIHMDRGQAVTGKTENDSLLYQVAPQLLSRVGSSARGTANVRPFLVVFKGEGASDFGGPFQEFLTNVSREIMGSFSGEIFENEKNLPSFNFFTPCGNGIMGVANNQDTVFPANVITNLKKLKAVGMGESNVLYDAIYAFVYRSLEARNECFEEEEVEEYNPVPVADGLVSFLMEKKETKSCFVNIDHLGMNSSFSSNKQHQYFTSTFNNLAGFYQLLDVSVQEPFTCMFSGQSSFNSGNYSNQYHANYVKKMCFKMHERKLLRLKQQNGGKKVEEKFDETKIIPETPEEEMFVRTYKRLRMFEAIGRLFATSMMTSSPLNINANPLLWKRLCGMELSANELSSGDAIAAETLRTLRTLVMENKISDDIEEALLDGLSFVIEETDILRLKNGINSVGATLPTDPSSLLKAVFENPSVNADNLSMFISLSETRRLQESSSCIDAIVRGLSSVIPIGLLRLMFDGSRTEVAISGVATIDLEDLERHTVCADAASKNMLFGALRSFSNSQLQSFIRFVSGRTRLPQANREWKMTVDTYGGGTQSQRDSRLPTSATCSFRLILPKYSSVEVMRSKLLYAAIQCTAIDLDTDVRDEQMTFATD